MAEGFAKKDFPKTIKIISAGSEPALEVNPLAIEVMKEVDIDISGQKPKLLTTSMLKGATHFISMGCGVLDSCPVPIVKEKIAVENWDLEDPSGKEIEFFREIRDAIEQKILDLKNRLEIK